ncbi:MAG: DUF86 domain-containing protein [Nitrospirae bacterium]|nr:MAG: DUF86 domain-containing protein [Nitrospirota bacterium]
MKREYTLYVKDIVESITFIEEFVANMDFEQFVSDEKTKNAVIKRLEIIGEAVKNIPQQVRVRQKDIPWSDLARMRDKLAHEYFGIRYDIVWRVIKKKLPQLKPKIKKVLEDLKSEQK